MATYNSPSSFQDPLPQTSSRRLPPPCWSDKETAALIDAYRDKWYSLRRSNLRATHWQEIADDVAERCHVSPQKTSIQCRHKMEKLRKRYRAEIQRAAAIPKGHRYWSSWDHFKPMDLMEKGSFYSDPAVDPVGQDEDNQDGLEGPTLYNSNKNWFRVKIPGQISDFPSLMKPNYGSGTGLRDGYVKLGFGIGENRSRGGGWRREVEVGNSGNPVEEMVAAIKGLGDGFVRMERMKMDMVREVESMRMEMEMRRTEMILESHQTLVDSFFNALLENKSKKVKRMPTPEC